MSDEDSKVAELQRRLVAVRWDIDEVRDEMREIESRALVEVAEERDDAGRVFSSERVRQAAVTTRLSGNKAYVDLKEHYRRLTRERDLLILEINERPTWPPRAY